MSYLSFKVTKTQLWNQKCPPRLLGGSSGDWIPVSEKSLPIQLRPHWEGGGMELWRFKLNSDLQAGIWFRSVAPSPIINLPPPLCFSHFCLKSCLFWACALVQCHIHFFHHVEFYFGLRQRISSTNFSGNIWCTLQSYRSPFWGVSSLLTSSSL